MFGFLNINKPKGMTSHDVVAKLRKITKIKQIGHTGTLDPLAEGVLPIAIGKASRLIEYLKEDKAYIAKLEFGKISDTYDIEGSISEYSNKKITQNEIEKALKNFIGTIQQTPPAYSAIHYNGKRLYELAREGNIPDEIPKRTVTIETCDLKSFNQEQQIAEIEIKCSKGTYIRSIVHDLGMNLQTGAIMTELTRTKSGKFVFDKSIKLKDLIDKQTVENNLINPIEMLNINSLTVNDNEVEKIKHGQAIPTDKFKENEIICLNYNSKICAIGEKKGSLILTKKVFIQ